VEWRREVKSFREAELEEEARRNEGEDELVLTSGVEE
jgi:hypothetical protein